MPLEAGALLLDVVGLGAPLWWLTGPVAQAAARARPHGRLPHPGAVAMLPSMPGWAFGLMLAGGLWLCLWTTRLRLLGLVPVAIGAIAAWAAPAPDVLVTGDGRHLVVVSADGTPLLLRDGAGDYVRQLFAEASGFEGDPANLGSTPFSACTRDSCAAVIRKPRGDWRLLATRISDPHGLEDPDRRVRRPPTSWSRTAGFRAAVPRAGSSSTRTRLPERAEWRSISAPRRASKPSPQHVEQHPWRY